MDGLFSLLIGCPPVLMVCSFVCCRVSFCAPDEEEEEGKDNELLVDLEEKDEKTERETSMWFSKV